jgi:hypothetical protein
MPFNMFGAPGRIYKTGGASVSGATYTSDLGGYVANVADSDVVDMLHNGCVVESIGGVIGRLLAADMNATTDQPIFLQVPTGLRYGITKIWCANASVSLTTAAGGIYPAVSKAGTAVVAAAQVYTAFTAATVFAGLTVVAGQLAVVHTENPLYLSLTTAQGAAATLDFFIFGDVLG